MKPLIWNFLLVLLVGLGFGSAQTNGAPAVGQAPVGTPVTASQPGSATPGQKSITISADPTVPDHILYHAFFVQVVAVEKIADKQEQAGKNVDELRTRIQKAAGLTDSEGASLREIAKDCIQILDEQKERIKAILDERHAQAPALPSQLTKGEMAQYGAESRQTVNDHIEQLKAALGDTSFAKLDAYVRKTIHPAAPSNAQTGSGTGPAAACDNPPCAIVSCGEQPCTHATGKGKHPITPMTPERKERMEQEKRYSMLFASIGADEDLAKREEAAGHPEEAASWRRDFARKSGLAPDEAEAVKKIAAQYREDQVTLNAQCRADLLAMKSTFAAEHAAGEKYSEVPSCDTLKALFPKAMADILTALGSKSFSRLDEYARHRLDNARILYRQPPPASGEVSATPAALNEQPQ